MDVFFRDLRFSLRRLRNAPAFALTAIFTLALGIGATTAIFSIVEGVLLRPLPFAQQSTLVRFGDQLETASGADLMVEAAISGSEILPYRHDLQDFSSLGVYRSATFELSGNGDPAQINAARLSADVFPILGVAPVIGRTFTADEDVHQQKLAVLSYPMWVTRFHADPDILGQSVFLDRQPYQIVGVMPRDFEFPLVPGQLNRSELWVPASLTAADFVDATGWNWRMIGRLKPGITPQRAQADAARAANEIMRTFPAAMASLRIRPVAEYLDESVVAQARPLVRTLLFAVIVVLFIACANLAGLLLVRVIRRRREVAVRLALGASAAGVIRQAIVETLTLSFGGGLLGLALAAAAMQVGVRFLPETLPRVSSISLDGKVVAFAILLAVLTGLVCGIVPALAAARTSVNDTLKEGGRTGSSGGGHARLRSALVVAEVAVALVLLVASGLLLRSFQKLREVDLGLRADHSLTATYSLPHEQYPTQQTIDSFTSRVLTQLAALPGVSAVGITSQLPLAGSQNTTGFYTEGYAPPKGAGLTSSWASQVTGDYFHAAGIPILRGRDLTAADRAGSPLVVIVNHTLAERYWPGQDPIGKRLHWGFPESPLPWMTVVGEIGDIQQTSADTPVQEQTYIPVGQFATSLGLFAGPNTVDLNSGSIVIRTALPPEQMASVLRATVHAIDPRLPLTQVESMAQIVNESETSQRFNTAIISAFAVAAVLLAILGIYSVIAFSATLRTQEMAIRLALGGQRSHIMGLILLSGAKLGLAGCVIGAIAALFATHLLRTLLFQVDPLDPWVLTLAAIAIFLLALLASLIPARRVAHVDPTQALRAE
jgi:predicted permease